MTVLQVLNEKNKWSRKKIERKYEVYSLNNETAPSNLMLKPSLVLKDMRLEN